jgi:hypothetical protein
MKEIQLTQGKVALVDDDIYEYLNQWKWYYSKLNYAMRSKRINKKKTFFLMHRVIMDTELNMIVDHLNGNGLDNRRSNLRNCTHAENMRNRKINKKNRSGFKGVSYYTKGNKWRAMIKFNNLRIHIGFYIDPIDAARAYNEAAIKYHGEFANLNKIY